MRKKRILIVDDENGFSLLLKMNLEQTGNYEVEVQNAGVWTFEAARRFRPDLILLDVVMPDISGREVAERLSADPKLKRIPVVYVTATVSREDAVHHQVVVNGHRSLAKPVGVQDVVDVIESVTAEGAATQQPGD